MKIEDVLEQAGSSLLVSSKRSRSVHLVGADGVVTAVGTPGAPFGIAAGGRRVHVVTDHSLLTYEVDDDLTAAGEHDAHYTRRSGDRVQDVGAHEMVEVEGDLWLTAANMSALVKVQPGGSVAVQWRLPWVTGPVNLENRCNLNGVAVRDGRPTHVTAFAQTNTEHGWRGDALPGAGVLVDVNTDEVVMDGLTAPHTPRWVGDKLWVCDSGNATVVSLDPKTGARKHVADLPGFTRGMAQVGHTMVVGVSETRGTVVDGLKVAAVQDTTAGLYGVNLVNHRVSHLLDLPAIPEVFDVQVVPHPTAMISD